MNLRDVIPNAENSTNFDVVPESITEVGSTLENLKAAAASEDEEVGVYLSYAKTAKEEGFPAIERHFRQIAEIEKVHADRFDRFARLLRDNKLFVSDVETGWICLNCGHVFTGKQAPAKCPVCSHDQGYFIRLELSPYGK